MDIYCWLDPTVWDWWCNRGARPSCSIHLLRSVWDNYTLFPSPLGPTTLHSVDCVLLEGSVGKHGTIRCSHTPFSHHQWITRSRVDVGSNTIHWLVHHPVCRLSLIATEEVYMPIVPHVGVLWFTHTVLPFVGRSWVLVFPKNRRCDEDAVQCSESHRTR